MDFMRRAGCTLAIRSGVLFFRQAVAAFVFRSSEIILPRCKLLQNRKAAGARLKTAAIFLQGRFIVASI